MPLYVVIFLNSPKADKTKIEYTVLIVDFAERMNAKHFELLNRELKPLKDIIRYLMYLKNDTGLSFSSRSRALATIKHFMEMNDIVLPWLQLSRFLGESVKNNDDRAYSYEEFDRLLAVSDLKYKAMILLLSSSGVRIGVIPGLKYGDLSKVPNYEIYKITVCKKRREEYYSFCTPIWIIGRDLERS